MKLIIHKLTIPEPVCYASPYRDVNGKLTGITLMLRWFEIGVAWGLS